jgi:hypothetical protein
MTVITRAFCRCNSGHYFTGEYCPFDGWSSSASRELAPAVKRLEAAGRKVTLAELAKAGLSAETLNRVVVMEFGSDAAAFEAMAPELVVVNGEAKPLRELESSLK